MGSQVFRRCSTCKADIDYASQYYKCSVSTCNKKATALYFCSVPCWDAHVPDARHRDAWAEVEMAPSGPGTGAEQATDHPSTSPALAASATAAASTAEAKVLRRVVVGRTQSQASDEESEPSDLPQDILIVVSKLKGYIKARSGLRTSDTVLEPLSAHLRKLSGLAIRSAAANERTTVLARDIEAVLRGETAED